MSKLHRRARATFALMALAGLAGIASADARTEEHERRSPRAAEVRQNRPAPPRAQAPRTQGWQAARPRQYAPPPYHREMAGRSPTVQRPANSRPVRESHFAGGGQVREFSRGPAGGQVRVFRNGNLVSGSVEHTIRPGLVSRTFVSGGHVLYTHVYQSHVWHQFGRTFGYETYVPRIRYPVAYYNWALGPWPQPVAFGWGWRVQPWYPVYGALFVPYAVYVSPDQWMTDYIISQNMQAAYQARVAVPVPPPAAETGDVSPMAQEQAPQPTDASQVPQSGEAPPAALPPESPPVEPSDEAPAAPAAVPPAALPPVITPQVKAELNTQIKVQLRERQAAAATPATLTTQSTSTPPALRPNHVFFEVVQPLDVPAATANHYCSLSANDYIKRTGGMSEDDWMIPVVVEASGPSDCPVGLHTRIGLNDLNAMENEQEAQVMEAMDAASKRMGPNGPPSVPGVHPTLIADGRATADPMALDAIRQAQ